ncbi:MAG TPA: hypothetical protein DDY88_02040 [Actinobacteria bacterium]|nr:hypothetical protein [Actinomycetota bacterium]
MSYGQPNSIPVGARYFAALLLLVAGLAQFFEGLTAVVHDNYYAIVNDYLVTFNIATWGWIHLILGVLLVLSGGFVLAGATWARLLGAVLAAISAVTVFVWIPYNPVGATILLALDVFVIWALLAHSHRQPA